jgi:uncharacterized protein (TIGR03437 family)
MKAKTILTALGLGMTAFPGTLAHAASVKLTALQIISTDANGKIQGVGAHRFRTANHGGHPCIFLVKGQDPEGEIFNGPNSTKNGINLSVPAGTHTYTIYAEKSNSYTWANYSINFFFDLSITPQISALTALNTASPDFFPPIAPNSEFTENLTGHSIKAPGTLVYKSGQSEVRLVSFHFSSPDLFSKDRVSPLEVRSNRTLDYVGEFTLEVSAPPEISAGGVVNGASFTPRVAPGSLFTIFGSSLAASTRTAAALPLSTNLGGASVTIGGKNAPLVYVSSDQINAQAPYELTEGPAVPVVVTVNGVASAAVNVAVVPAAPGIFQYGIRRAVVQNADYTTNTVDNGAAPDSYVIAYLTGTGHVDNPVATGAPAGADPLSRPRANVTATIDDTLVEVAFAGLTPNFVGLTQVNLKVPRLAPGTYPLVIGVNGEKSNQALITIK